MTDHPCKGMTPNQIAAFEQLAINQYPQDGWRSIDALLKAGVIEKGEGEKRRDALGVYEVPRFIVPLPVHMQWCAWCSEQPDVDAETGCADDQEFGGIPADDLRRIADNMLATIKPK